MCVCVRVCVCVCVCVYLHNIHTYINKYYIHCKATDWINFPHYTTAHPKSIINNIPYSQALVLKKICTKIYNVIVIV